MYESSKSLGKASWKKYYNSCAGFIGMHLCKSLLDDGYEVFQDNNGYYDINLKKARL